MDRPLSSVSIIVTTRNEAERIGDLMHSLAGQAHVREVILVDANSDDGTVDAAKAAATGIRLRTHQESCSRGEGRNIGARLAEGDLFAFIDGDCTAAPGWTAALVSAWSKQTDCMIAGRTEQVGPHASKRAPILVDGQDISWPSCNLAVPRKLFENLDGFDADFLTAEDMDLNLRAVQLGATIQHAPDALVHARTRPDLRSHLKQAYEYGIGRAQLERKHGALAKTSKWKALRSQPTPAGLMRLWMGWRGHRAAMRGDA